MHLTLINDSNALEIQIYRQLRDNVISEDNSFIADSPKVVNVLLETNLTVKSILATSEYYEQFESLLERKRVPTLYVADKNLMERIVGHKIHHNVMMCGVRPKQVPVDALGNQIIMLDEISSTENIGSIARSAAALGIGTYLLPLKGPHPYSRRALRVSMGHVSKLKVHLYNDISETIELLKQRGYKIFAAEVAEGATALANVEISEKWVLLMGHEGKGLSPDIIAMCDYVVQIEMDSGVRSLNVGVAASIMMYQFKQKSIF